MKLGEHLLIDIICENYDILNSLEKLEELSDKLIKICKLTKVSELKHKFEPQGITQYFVINKSSIKMIERTISKL